MILVLKYFCVSTLYGIGLIIFSYFIYCHLHLQHASQMIFPDEHKKIYDYIVVGSGTAGSIIAYRLAKNTKNTVLLLEAGSYSNFLYSIPAISPILQRSPLDWNYKTEPQTSACWGLENNSSFWPMGKLVGGTHRFNNMIYFKGYKKDYDEWYKDKIDYNYQTDILYYFKKLENMNENQKFSDGAMFINNLEHTSVLADAIIKGAETLQFSSNFKGNLSGFTKPHVTTKSNKRWTTSDHLLNENFKNLQIITNARVAKILFKHNFEAHAVHYVYLHSEETVKAKKGIILSAGTIGTANILLNSGIGPKNHLKSLKMRVRKNLPVGENLQDHIITGLDLVTLNQTLSTNLESFLSPISAWQYFFNSKGPWTSAGCEVIGFYHIQLQSNQPELQFMVLPLGVSSDGGKHLRKIISLKEKLWDNYFINLINKQAISIAPILLHPKSRGTVRLRDINQFSKPIINPNYLSHPKDVEILIKGIRLIKEIIKTEPMQKLGAQLNRQHFPGCENFKFNSWQYWECYVRHLTLTSFHPVGTCKMGGSLDSTAVVDYHFRVKGTNKLFIADGSVMPTLISGNINSAIGLIAEKAADSVKYYEFLSSGNCRKIEVFISKKFLKKC